MAYQGISKSDVPLFLAKMPFPAITEASHGLDFEYPDFLHFKQLPPHSDEWPLRGWFFMATISSLK